MRCFYAHWWQQRRLVLKLTSLKNFFKHKPKGLLAPLPIGSHRSEVFLEGIASRPLFRDPSTLYAAEVRSVDVLQDTMERLGKSLTQGNVHKVDLAQASLARIGKSLVVPFESQAAVVTSRFKRSISFKNS